MRSAVTETFGKNPACPLVGPTSVQFAVPALLENTSPTGMRGERALWAIQAKVALRTIRKLGRRGQPRQTRQRALKPEG